MAKWILWAGLLIIQQASHTLSSRAKNSSSVAYNATVGVFSNGVWFVSQLILVDDFVRTIARQDWVHAISTGLFYTTFCVIGSVIAQILALKWENRTDYDRIYILMDPSALPAQKFPTVGKGELN